MGPRGSGRTPAERQNSWGGSCSDDALLMTSLPSGSKEGPQTHDIGIAIDFVGLP